MVRRVGPVAPGRSVYLVEAIPERRIRSAPDQKVGLHVQLADETGEIVMLKVQGEDCFGEFIDVFYSEGLPVGVPIY